MYKKFILQIACFLAVPIVIRGEVFTLLQGFVRKTKKNRPLCGVFEAVLVVYSNASFL